MRARGALLGLVALLVALGTVCSAGAPAFAADSRAAAVQSPSDRYESRLQAVVNSRRATHGLRPLRFDPCTDRIAERWGRHLARNGAFEHQSLSPLLRRCEARWAGETLAYGRITPRRMVRMWMHSPGHRAILLSRRATHVGIGAARDSRGWVVAADFTRR